MSHKLSSASPHISIIPCTTTVSSACVSAFINETGSPTVNGSSFLKFPCLSIWDNFSPISEKRNAPIALYNHFAEIFSDSGYVPFNASIHSKSCFFVWICPKGSNSIILWIIVPLAVAAISDFSSFKNSGILTSSSKLFCSGSIMDDSSSGNVVWESVFNSETEYFLFHFVASRFGYS